MRKLLLGLGLGLLCYLPTHSQCTLSFTVPSSQNTCSGGGIGPLSFSGPLGTTFSWTNNNPAIGLPASGTGQTIPDFVAANPGNNPVTATITVTANRFDTLFGYLPSGNGLLLRDLSNGINRGTIPLHSAPVTIVPNATGTRLYVALDNIEEVAVIDVATSTVIRTLLLSSRPTGMALSSDGSRLFVNENLSNTVAVFDVASNARIGTIPVGNWPYGLVANPVQPRVYCTNYNDGTLSVINTQTMAVEQVVTLQQSQGPAQPACSPDGSRLFIPNFFSHNVHIINTSNYSQQSVFPGGTWLQEAAFSTDGSRVYVSHSQGFHVLDAQSGQRLNTYNTGQVVNGLSVSADNHLYLVNANGGIGVYNMNTGFADPAITTGGTYAIGNGQFLLRGMPCATSPQTFTITVAPSATATVVYPGQPYCQGGAPLLPQRFGASGGTFSGTAGLVIDPSTGAVNPALTPPGIYTVSYSGNNGGACGAFSATTHVSIVASGATMDQPVDLSVCGGAATAPVVFSSPTPGVHYSWTNSNPAIGLPQSGVGPLPSFIAQNSVQPATITVTPATGVGSFSYVANYSDGTVSVVDNTTQQLIKTITVGVSPRFVSVGRDNRFVYVANNTAGTISIISTATNTVVNTLTIGGTINGLVESADGHFLYALASSNPPAGNLVTIDAFTQTVVGSVPAGGSPFAITVSPDGQWIYVGNAQAAGGVSVFHAPTRALVANIPVVGGAYGLQLNADGSKLYVSNFNVNGVRVYNTATLSLTNTIALPSYPWSMALSPNGQTLYVITPTQSALVPINTSTETAGPAYSLPAGPQGVSVSADGSRILVACDDYINNLGLLVVLNASGNVLQQVIVGSNPDVLGNFVTGGGSCAGASKQFTITVKAGPTVNAVPNQVLCPGMASVSVGFSSPQPGTQFSWTNQLPQIGVAASGNGNLPSFTAQNAGVSVLKSMVKVTPSLNGCTGAAGIFYLIVNPAPTLNAIASQTVCKGTPTSAVTFSSPVPGSTFSWTNSTPAIGLAASGQGNIASFTGANATNALLTGTINVTPVYSNGISCAGPAQSFTISVKPAPAPTSTIQYANSPYCQSGTATVTFSGTAGGIYSALPAGLTINPATGAIDLASSATGSYTVSYTVTPNLGCPEVSTAQLLVNPGSASIQYSGSPYCAVGAASVSRIGAAGGTYSAVPAGLSINPATGAVNLASSQPGNYTVTYDVAATVSCPAIQATASLVVKVTPTVNAVGNQVLCPNTSTQAVSFSGPLPNTVFSWQNSIPSIGLAGSGVGAIGSFTALNGGNTVLKAGVKVTPLLNGCAGPSMLYYYIVNPTPTVNAEPDQSYCNGPAPATLFSGPVAGAKYFWTNNNTATGVASNGLNKIPAFTATNNTALPLVSTILVSPQFGNGGVTCFGPASTFTITVNSCISYRPPVGAESSAAKISIGADELVVGPSPTRGALRVQYSGATTPLLITIRDAAGSLLRTHRSSTATLILDMSALPAGVYLVDVLREGDGMRWSKRIVKL